MLISCRVSKESVLCRWAFIPFPFLFYFSLYLWEMLNAFLYLIVLTIHLGWQCHSGISKHGCHRWLLHWLLARSPFALIAPQKLQKWCHLLWAQYSSKDFLHMKLFLQVAKKLRINIVLRERKQFHPECVNMWYLWT